MKTPRVLFFLLILLTFGCDPHKSAIKKNLDSRFTKFEIVEIRKDSANVITAMNEFLALSTITAKTNLKIITALSDMDNKIKTPCQTFLYTDSLEKYLDDKFTDFSIRSRINRVDPCYYVKYLVHKDEIKIPREEYFYINENGDVLHRPYNWNEFLYELKYEDLAKEGNKYFSEIIDLEFSCSKKK